MVSMKVSKGIYTNAETILEAYNRRKAPKKIWGILPARSAEKFLDIFHKYKTSESHGILACFSIRRMRSAEADVTKIL